MRRSVVSRLGAVVAGVLLLLSPLVACGTPPTTPRITVAFHGLTLLAPDEGVLSGENADFTYKASGVPRGGRIFLQKAAISGDTIRWSNVSQLSVGALGSGTIIRPSSGVNTYRLGIFDAHGKGLASAPLPLDVYLVLHYSDLTTRPVQTLNYTQGGQGGPAKTFQWVFQAEIDIQNTSCRLLGELQIFNAGFRAGQFEFDQTVGNKTTKTVTTIAGNNFEANGPQTVFKGALLTTLHSELDLRIIDSPTSSTAIYGGDAEALCLTDTGSF